MRRAAGSLGMYHGDIYILRHDVGSEFWELTMFARGATHEQAHG